jgi:cell division protein FtsZ
MNEKLFAKWQKPQQVMIVGVGGFGCKMAALMQEQELAGVTTVACDTDQKDLESVEVQNRLLLEKECPSLVWRIIDKSIDFMTSVYDTTNEPSLPTFNTEPIRKLLNADAKTIIIAAGLGGVCGTNAAAQIAREAKAAGKHTIAVVTMPFSFEGSKRMNQALSGLSELAPHVGKLHVLNIHNLIDGNTNAAQAFTQAEKIVCGIFYSSLCDWNTMKNGDADSRKVEAN